MLYISSFMKRNYRRRAQIKPNESPDGLAGQSLGAAHNSAIYPPSYEWVVETSHGIYTARGWGFAIRAGSRDDAVRICEDWKWDRMRAYNNLTGEIVDSPNEKAEPQAGLGGPS